MANSAEGEGVNNTDPDKETVRGMEEEIDDLSTRLVAAEPELTRLREENREMRELLERVENVVLADHPHAKLMREGLETGELARRLKTIGEAFDPGGRVRLLLDIRALLGRERDA